MDSIPTRGNETFNILIASPRFHLTRNDSRSRRDVGSVITLGHMRYTVQREAEKNLFYEIKLKKNKNKSSINYAYFQ